jgi:hypothetical protein
MGPKANVWIERHLLRLVERTTLLVMDDIVYKTLQHLQRGDALITSGVNGIIQSWEASTEVIGKLCTGNAERWQAAIRKMQAPVNLAEILRARTSCWSDI